MLVEIVQTIEEDNEYIITMSVDAAYLNSENTVYPVYVDPSITLQTSFSQDATIYSNYAVNEGNASNMFAGSYTNRYGGTRGVARSLVKFPGLFANSTFQSLSASRIYKVQYIPRDTMCESDAVWIDCYRVTQNWSEGTVKCNSSIWNAYTGFLDDAYVYYNGGTGSMGTGTGHWYPFDITEAVKDWKNGLYGGTSNHYGIMFKAYNESNSAKTFGINNNSSLGPNIIVEYDPAVTGISLSSTCKEVNVGWSGSIEATVYPASALNKTVYWESSDSNVASINPTSGLICAGLAGSTVITATTADGGFKATCTLTVNQVLTGADTYITDADTRNAIIRCKNTWDYVQNEYLTGNISYAQKNVIQNQANHAADIARADFIIVNDQSNFAYQYFKGRNKIDGDVSPFNRDLQYNANNPMTGLDVIVVQRGLQVLGYFEPDEQYVYGTYDLETHNAASQMTALLSGQKFDAASYRVIFQASTASLRKPEWLKNLMEYSRQHLTVQLSLAAQVQGKVEVGIKQGGSNGGTGRADVLKDYGSYSRIWEVKPYKNQYLTIGNTQLQRYVDKANSVSGQSFSTPLYRGFDFNDYYIEYNATSVLKVYGTTGVAGLVQYEIKPKTSGLQYELVPVTVPEYDYQFDASKLQAVIGGVLVIGAVGGLIYVTVQSGGTAAPVTVPLIYKLLYA